MIDTHCHLTFPDYAGRVEETLAAAAAAGVSGCITISTTTVDCLAALALAERHERVWCTAGVHPLYSHKGPHAWENVGRAIRHPKCVAWGELGLDNHHPTPGPDVQRPVLDEQLAFIAAVRRGADGGGAAVDKPIVLHCREAFEDLIPVLERTGMDPGKFVFHCFTGGPAEMRRVLDFGACVSFTGVVTYRNADEVRQAARLVPEDRLLVETDAPFLSPEPKRGVRPNQPAFVRLVVEALAAARGTPFDDLHAALNRNTERFFGIPAR